MARADIRQKHFRYLIEKHQESYEVHFGDLLMRRDLAICDLRRQIHGLEKEAVTWFAPQIKQRREELDRLRHRVAEIDRHSAAAVQLVDLRRRNAELAQTLVRTAEQSGRLITEMENGQAERNRIFASGQQEIARLQGWVDAELAEKELRQTRATREKQQWREALDAQRKELVTERKRGDEFEAKAAQAEELRLLLAAEQERALESAARTVSEVAAHERERERATRTESELDEARRQLVGLRAALNNANDAIDAFYASASWKMTSPLRRGLTTLRRLRGKRS